MTPEIHLALHQARAAELRAEAEAFRMAAAARARREDVRTRVGWTLVEVGLRLATPRPGAALSS